MADESEVKADLAPICAAPVTPETPAVPQGPNPQELLERIGKLTDDLQKTNLELSVEKGERKAAERARDTAQTERDLRWDELVAKQEELNRMRKSKGEVAADRDRWKLRAEKAEACTPAGFKAALDEAERLRVEISALHKLADGQNKAIEDRDAERRVLARSYSDLQTRCQMLESTAQQMQAGRDVADKREAQAFKALGEQKALNSKYAEQIADLNAEFVPARAKLGQLVGLHRKEHAKPLPFCAMCKLIAPPATATAPVEAAPAQAS